MKLGKTVIVQDGNVDKALRKLKQKVSDSGLFLELQNKQQYIKPTTRRKIAKAQAIKRWKKFLQSQLLPTKDY